MQNAIAIIEEGSMVTMNAKGAQGTFARAIAFASRDVRMAMGQALYAKWLANGQYRPIVNDILSCGLVSKAAVPYVAGLVPTNGSISKDAFVGLCKAVVSAVQAKGADKAPKGQKGFVYEVIRRIVEASEATTVEAGQLRRAA